MLPGIIILVYLAIVAVVGAVAFGKRKKASGDDFFLASRSIGEVVFLLSLFGTNMTAFAILGSSGMAYHRGIGVFGLMASSSALIIPLTLLIIGTRLWALGKRFGHVTQVDYFRDRWDTSHVGTIIFIVTVAMLVPYIIIALIGGGNVIEALSTYTDHAGHTQHFLSYELGAAAVVASVTIHIFLGGMRGAAWVNTFQTILFLVFGSIAFVLIGRSLGHGHGMVEGYRSVLEGLAKNPKSAALLSRQTIPPAEFLSYMFIPLSAIMFPHMAMMCLSARRMSAFKKTVVAYPICIMMIWLPSVFLGVVAASQFKGLTAGESNDVLLLLLNKHTTEFVAALLGAGIMSCVMAADSHQILAIVTMFTRDIFAHYGGHDRFGPRAQEWTGRIFVLIISAVAYAIALYLKNSATIFELAIRFAFSGFAALAPVMVAALFWKRSTKWGALAATLWSAAGVLGSWWLFTYSGPAFAHFMTTHKGPPAMAIFPSLGHALVRTPGNVTLFGYLPVVPMVLGSALLMWAVSLVTAPPSQATLDRYFPAATPSPTPSPEPAR